MWVHIIIFAGITAAAVLWKAGAWKPDILGEKENRRLFFGLALAGNLLGALLTFQNGSDTVYEKGSYLKKEDGLYEQEFLVTVQGKDSQKIQIQVPEKENPQAEEAVEEEETLSEEEKLEQEILEAVTRLNEEKNDPDKYFLPDSLDEKSIQWKVKGETTGEMFAGLSLIASMLVLIGKMKEKEEVLAKRREQMAFDYPGLVMKFTLLVQAGLTIRRAFSKIAFDYKKSRKEGRERFAYEEMLITCYEMESGVSEAEAYRRFGERCGQVKYKTLATLLVQNLQKGSQKLLEMLEQESVAAWEDRKRKAKVMGEMAATKLLFPMVLMLLVVLAIIMVPACLSFYG